MMKRCICHPWVLFQYLLIFHCPTMFIWVTCVQLQHLAGLLSTSQRCRLSRSRTCKPCKSHILQAFIQTCVCIWCAWVSKHLCLNDVQTHTAKVPLPPLSSSQTYNILFPTAPPPPLPLHWFTSSFTASLTFYGDDVHTSFNLRTISPCLKFTEAQKGVRYLKKHFIYHWTEFQ